MLCYCDQRRVFAIKAQSFASPSRVRLACDGDDALVRRMRVWMRDRFEGDLDLAITLADPFTHRSELIQRSPSVRRLEEVKRSRTASNDVSSLSVTGLQRARVEGSCILEMRIPGEISLFVVSL